MFDGWRKGLVQGLDGTVLEIGVGTGENLPHYRRAQHVYAIEPDPARAAEARLSAARVPFTVEIAPAEALPYDDASFDHVVSSLVFCSVADPQRALREIDRVLRPGGALHMVEHVRPATPVLADFFSAVTPWWSRVACNCHLDRPTIDVLQAEGWTVQVRKRRAMFVRMECRRSADSL
ncbi:MAG: class I SAM-dependent methyltransferase [Caldilineaceae bacterium]|nr:class I SAM-dependent methyltransferase [Caldilineaceae bacterium]